MTLDLLSQLILQKSEFRGETTITVTPESLHEVCRYCRAMLGYDYLLDITAVDHLDRSPRFEVVYQLNNAETAEQLRIKTSPLSSLQSLPSLPTVSDIWPGANWIEREVFDLSGIHFENHPDLRRIAMWEGYPHHPMRKDFPLEGVPTDIPEIAFSEAAPLKGGPFVTATTNTSPREREPRARQPQT